VDRIQQAHRVSPDILDKIAGGESLTLQVAQHKESVQSAFPIAYRDWLRLQDCGRPQHRCEQADLNRLAAAGSHWIPANCGPFIPGNERPVMACTL